MVMNKNLDTVKNLTNSTELISDTLILLKEKRITLEEKMIRTHLLEVVEKLSQLKEEVDNKVAPEGQLIDDNTIEAINQLTASIDEVVNELKKAIEYNWNYLEQYFEHGFYGRLVNEHKFLIKINSIIESIQS